MPWKTIPAAIVAGAGAQVDDPVGVGHHRLMMFDDDHGFAGVDQSVQKAKQLRHVGQVQACGGFIEHIDVALLTHLRGQLQTLSLTTRERGQRLTQADVAQPDIG